MQIISDGSVFDIFPTQGMPGKEKSPDPESPKEIKKG